MKQAQPFLPPTIPTMSVLEWVLYGLGAMGTMCAIIARLGWKDLMNQWEKKLDGKLSIQEKNFDEKLDKMSKDIHKIGNDLSIIVATLDASKEFTKMFPK